MKVAFDATSLLDPRTGVATFAHEVLARLATYDGIEVVAFAVSWRGRGRLPALVPRGVDVMTLSLIHISEPTRPY